MWTLSFKDVEVKDVEVSNLFNVNENSRPIIPIIPIFVVPNNHHQMFPNHVQYILPSISQTESVESNNNIDMTVNDSKGSKLSDTNNRFPHNFISKNIKVIECKSVSPMQFFNIQDSDCNNANESEFANSEGSGTLYDDRIESALLHESSKNVTLVPDLMAPILQLSKEVRKKCEPSTIRTNVFTPIPEIPDEEITQEDNINDEDNISAAGSSSNHNQSQEKIIKDRSLSDKNIIAEEMSMNELLNHNSSTNGGATSPSAEVKLNNITREDFDLLRPKLFLSPTESLDVDLNAFMDPLIGSFTFFSNSASPKKFLVSEEENMRIRAALLNDLEKDVLIESPKRNNYVTIPNIKREPEEIKMEQQLSDPRLTPNTEDSDDVLSSSSPADLGSETVKPFSCEVCSATFNRLGNYTRHKKVHLSNSRRQYPRFECEECGKSFIQRCDLTRHQHIHSGTEPHRCDLCGKGYIRHSDLVIHQRFHNKEKPFNCPQCGKGFSQRGDLNRHVRSIHLQGKPMACSHCHKKFVKETSLVRHIHAFHTNQNNIKTVLESCGRDYVPSSDCKLYEDSSTSTSPPEIIQSGKVIQIQPS